MGNNIKLLVYKAFIRFVPKSRTAAVKILMIYQWRSVGEKKGIAGREGGKFIKLACDLFLKARKRPQEFPGTE